MRESASTQPALPESAPGWRIAVLSGSMLLSSLGTSIANVALPTLADVFSASFHAVQWVVLAYLLAVTALIVSVGRLGDVLGRGRLLRGGLALFTLASVLCGIAPSLGWLIAARGLQGLGAAVMMALTLAMVSAVVPKERTGRAMGLLGTMSAVGTALGPSLGGLLIAAFGWPAVFLVNVPLGVAVLFLALRYLPADATGGGASRAGFDVPGTVLLVAALTAYALAMTLGHGPFGVLNGLLLAGAMAGLAGFAVVEGRASSPLIDLSVFRDRVLTVGLAANGAVAAVIMSTFVVGAFYLSRGLGLDAVRVGLVMAAGPVVSALSGVPAGHLVDRLGTVRASLAGLGLMVAGCIILAVAPLAFGLAGYLAGIVTVTPGYQLFQAANNTGVMTGVAPDRKGVIAGLLSLSRNLGLISGASVIAAIFAAAVGNGGVATAAPQAVIQGTAITFLAAAGLLVVALGAVIASRRDLHRSQPASLI